MKKLGLSLGSLGISVLLVGCVSGEKEMLSVSDQVKEQETIVVEKINEVASEESKLQKQFSDTLTEDKELTSMKDSSSVVFENIENRNAALKTIQEATGELSDQAEKIKEISVKNLSEKDIKDLQSNLETSTSTLNEWLDTYESYLKEEGDYFKSLSTEEATYETFSDGLEKLNEQHQQSNDKLDTIDEQLSELSSSRESVAKSLENKDEKK